MNVVVETCGDLPRRRVRALVIMTAFMLLAVVSVTNGPAWSFEVPNTDVHGQSSVVVPVMRAPADPAGDSCLYILKAGRERDGPSTADRQYRQASGSAAVIGLVFGVRFALGPSEVTTARRRTQPVAAFRVWETRENGGGGQALAIADYRACRNEQALRTLTD
jgi:hypothetical protein